MESGQISEGKNHSESEQSQRSRETKARARSQKRTTRVGVREITE